MIKIQIQSYSASPVLMSLLRFNMDTDEMKKTRIHPNNGIYRANGFKMPNRPLTDELVQIKKHIVNSSKKPRNSLGWIAVNAVLCYCYTYIYRVRKAFYQEKREGKNREKESLLEHNPRNKYNHLLSNKGVFK